MDPQIFGYRFLLPTTYHLGKQTTCLAGCDYYCCSRSIRTIGRGLCCGVPEWAPPNRRSERAFKYPGIIRRRTATVQHIMGTVYLLNVATIFGDKHSAGSGGEILLLQHLPSLPPSIIRGQWKDNAGAHDIKTQVSPADALGGNATPHGNHLGLIGKEWRRAFLSAARTQERNAYSRATIMTRIQDSHCGSHYERVL